MLFKHSKLAYKKIVPIIIFEKVVELLTNKVVLVELVILKDKVEPLNAWINIELLSLKGEKFEV